MARECEASVLRGANSHAKEETSQGYRRTNMTIPDASKRFHSMEM